MSLSAEELKEYKQAFNFSDKDKDGKIGANEIGVVMRAVGMMPNEHDLKAINDKQGGKPIDFDGFIRICSESTRKIVSEDVLKAFKKFDKDRQGVLSVHDVKHALLTLGEKFSDAEVLEFTTLAGGDKIVYKDFVNAMAQYK